ncbi:hypothetical protein KORDIASMS9_01021 [Kordia sp. SMS9]|uniref:hypothetical protein n=1 Tax=Kordia sp. SMS9 TaxID=2282170 RepID=UPI000E0DCCE3|nr:hypothetical protein [Kordia sp. SMS9]AXG68805.1 hypothetical protein KORDIASMS9_01021 [Kordia sp. SMS9]
MNKFQAINVEYLRGSRTLETILVTKKNSSKVFYIYNYEGNSFRVFENLLSLMKFFQNKFEGNFHFQTETELDEFLAKVKISP